MDADVGRRLVEQTADDVQTLPERHQRLERGAQFHRRARSLGPPVVRVDAVGHEDDGETLGEVFAPAGAACAPHTGIDSSHGRSMATPAPRRNVRRDATAAFIAMVMLVSSLSVRSAARATCRILRHSLVEELRAGDEGLDEAC